MHMHTRVYIYIHMCVLSHSVMSNCLQLQGLQLLDSSVHGNSPGKNIGVACHDLLQGIFPTQRQNPGLPHCRQILYLLSQMQGMTYPYSKTSYNVSISRMGNLASKRLYNVAGTYFPTFPPSTLILIPQPLHLVFFCQTNYSTKSESESEVAQSCPTLCNPMDCTLPGSSIHGIFQARILEWVAISFSRKSSRPRD